VKVRLHQFLSRTGQFSSKREVKEAVWSGEVTVAGSVVKDIAFQFNANTKEVHWMGEQLHLPGLHHTYVLNKPRGVICSRLNRQERSLGKHSVFELLKEHVDESTYDRMLTVGRLDEATTGLLILTTDGQLVHRIASPESKVDKTYAVKTEKPVAEHDLSALRQGVTIELEENGEVSTYKTGPARVEVEKDGTLLLTISDGKKRQVRRMFGVLGYEVIDLHRRSIGGLNLALLNIAEGASVEMDQRLLCQSIFDES
jgi:pseudouridine synthase